MFGIGLFELLLFAAVALVVLGPEKLPLAARTAGLWYGKLRRTLNNMQHEIETELNLAEAKRQMQEELAKIKATEQNLQESMQRMEKDIQAMQAQTEQQVNTFTTNTTHIVDNHSEDNAKIDIDNTDNADADNASIDNVGIDNAIDNADGKHTDSEDAQHSATDSTQAEKQIPTEKQI